MNVRTLIPFTSHLLALWIATSPARPAFSQAGPRESEVRDLNTVSLHLTSAHLDPLEGNSVIRAFVPTESKSVDCLATLNEIRTDVWPTGITVFCAEREPAGLGGVPGVLISVFFTQPAPPDVTVDATLYQKGARKYGPPILCTAVDGC